MVSSRSAMAVRTASAGSQVKGFSDGSTTFISGCARGFFASLASPVSAADLTATLAPSKARSPVGQLTLICHRPAILRMYKHLTLGTSFCAHHTYPLYPQ